MKQIRRALLCLLIAALALSLCACDRPGQYTEYILTVSEKGEIEYALTWLSAVEDPDVDGDGEAETTEEIIEYKREEFQNNIEEKGQLELQAQMAEAGIRSWEFRYEVVDGIVYTGFYFDLTDDSLGGSDPILDPFVEHRFGQIVIYISTEESLFPEEKTEETGAEPATESAEGEPEVEHAPDYGYLVIHMPGPAKTNAGVAEGNTVTINLDDPSQWEGLYEIEISAAVLEPILWILPLVVLLAGLAAWLLIRRRKNAAAEAEAPAAEGTEELTAAEAGETPAPEELTAAEANEPTAPGTEK